MLDPPAAPARTATGCLRLQLPTAAVDLPSTRRFPESGKVDWRQTDFTRFSKTGNPAGTRYNHSRPARPEAALS